MTEMKTEIPGMYKVREGIVINKDDAALKAYKARKIKAKKVDHLEKEMEEIKSSLDEIKGMLRGMVK